MRGALTGAHISRCRRGIIPACAGSTQLVLMLDVWQRDHPRMCGEHSGPKPAPKGMPGSSPHVRGAHSLYLRQLFADGIIPACAGSTSTIRDVCYRHGDHPRMCGEHDIRRSLPRTACGIIPACAGSTPTRPRITNSARDHPRMCGEHSFLSILKMFSMGSSPHVRGAQRGCYQGLRAGGIIPACAGSTQRRCNP